MRTILHRLGAHAPILAVLLGLLGVVLLLRGSSHATVTLVAALAAALGLVGMCLTIDAPPDP